MSNKNSLWAIKTPSVTHHLLGSVHFLRKENHPFSAAIENAFEVADVVVFELDIEGLSAEEQRILGRERGTFHDGTRLPNILPRHIFKMAHRRARELGINLSEMKIMKPWFLWLNISILSANMSGCDPEYGVEKYLLSKLKTSAKQVIYLEGFKDQLNFLDGIPPAAQEIALAHTLKIFDEIPQRFEAIGRAWSAGDVDALEALTLELAKEHPEVNKALITVRNENWLPEIEAYINSDRSHLIVVGVGHLVGETGIVRMLQNKGYSVEQL
jgi:uncharacterized protein YbaP (TraB family)